MRYRQPREDEFFETRTPRMSDDYKKGGKVRGGGCERQGKTKGRFV
jgi:hypothetical protein